MGYGIKEIKGNDGGLTLKKVSINGNICGNYAEISINQVYENSSNNDIDGIYVFPIPKSALISDFGVEIGGRTLRTIVEEREKALKIYENARKRGENAFFLEEFKPHLFKISLGKIISGETVSIKLSYIDELEYKGDTLKLVIPAIFEPKRIDGTSKIINFKNNMIDKVLRRDKDENEFEFKTNILVESLCRLEFESPNHKLKIEREGDTKAKITLEEEYDTMDRDLVLFMKEQERLEADGMIYEYKEKDIKKGMVHLRVIPKLDYFEEEEAENYIFLIDISNTMEGKKLEQAKNALQLCIRNLSEGDRFDIIAMGENLKYFWDEGMADFNADNLKKASIWIDNLATENDADIFGAIKYSLKNEGGCNTILIFTDDQVEEEVELLAYVREHIGDNRIFTFGIDSSTNNYFLNKLAHESYGKAEFINKGQRIEDVVLKQFKRIQNPEVDDIQIDWGSLKVESTYPRTIDYMYDREPFFIFADVLGEVSGEITIRGKVHNKEYIKKINLDNFNTEDNANLLKKVWARKRIKSIELNMRAERGEKRDSMRNKVVELSKSHGIISRETTFIFMELREEPVLGIELKNIIPIKVNESTLVDETDVAEFVELEKSRFFYKQHEETLETSERKYLNDNEYLDRIYPREKLLRIIAKNQYADGAFVDYEDSSTEDKIETTAMSLLAFTIGEEDIDIYFIQLDKAVRFLCNNCKVPTVKLDDKLLKMTIIALKRIIEKQMAKVKTLEITQETVEFLYHVLNTKGYTTDTLNNLIDNSFKKNIISLFNVSLNNTITEAIVINDEKSSIFSMSKLAVLKGLKYL